MPRLNNLKTSLSYGELDPLMFGRSDLKQYSEGLAKARNVWLLPQGGASRRDGLEYIHPVPPAATGGISETRIFSFVFSTTQTYKVIFSDLSILIINPNGVVVAILTSIYSHLSLYKLNITQSLDSIYIFHEDYPMHILKRTGAGLWTLAAMVVTDAPKYGFTVAVVSPAGTLSVPATAGTLHLTSSIAVFLPSHVNQFINGNGGRARILSCVSATDVVVTTKIPFYDITAIAATKWTLETGYEDVWSATRGYPRTGSFHQGRLWVGGSRELPMSLWASKIDNFGSFGLGTSLADEGISVTLASGEVASINQIHSGINLEIFTTSSEFFIPTSSNAPITPTNIIVKRSTNFGSADFMPVFGVDMTTVFLNRRGSSVRQAVFDSVAQTYAADPLSLLASHLLVSPVDIAYRRATIDSAADYIFVVNSDGTMAVLNTLRSQQIMGWSLIEVQGLIKNVAVELDTVFIIVERVVNGNPTRHVEQFNANHVLDSSKYYATGLPSSTFTGLSHLEGETVKVVADGNVLPPVVVSGGQVTISRPATTFCEIGLGFKAVGNDYTIQTMPIEVALQDGTMVGKKKRLVESTVIVSKTKSLLLNNQQVSFRHIGANLLDSSATEFTGQKVVEGMLGYYDDLRITIGDNTPQRATITAISYKVAV